MELQDPVVAYTAASNLQGHEIAEMLVGQGIRAHVIEDHTPQSMWLGGLNSSIHKPQVWVSKSELDGALGLIREFEERQRIRLSANRAQRDQHATVVFATCDQCGAESEFPVAQSGTIQNCPFCSTFMDVDPDSESSEWDVGEPESTTESQFDE